MSTLVYNKHVINQSCNTVIKIKQPCLFYC